MDEQKNLVEQLKAEIAELRDGEKTLENARTLLTKKAELETAQAELAEIEAAFAEETPEQVAEADAGDGDGEEEAGEAGEDAGAEDGAGEADDDAGEPAEETPVEDAPAEEAVAPVALAASAADVDVSPTAEAGETHPGFHLTASANMNGVSTGQQLDRERLRKMLSHTLTAGGNPTGGTVRLFEMNRFADDVKVPTSNAIESSRIIAEARKAHSQPLALTAGACFCGPDEVDPSIGVYGRRGRPVAGIFPTIPINGGFRYLRDLTIDPDSGSVGIWTCADQDNVDPDDSGTWKTCSELDCFDEISVTPYMVKGCTTVRRQQNWAHPEQVDAWLNKLMIEYDRIAERELLDQIETDAGAPLTVGTDQMLTHGLLSQIVYALGNLSFSLGYQFRADALAGHTVIVPRGLIAAALTDELLRGFPSGVRTEAEVVALLEQGYGIRLVERLDESSSQAAAAATTVTNLNAGGAIDSVPPMLLPNLFRLYVLRPDQWVHGEGVLVGADWHVDNAMLRQNKMQYFWENVEVLERTGVEKAYIVDVEGCPNGARSDLTTPPDCES